MSEKVKYCEKCELPRLEHEFNGSSGICIYCEAEIEAVGEPITKENLGNIMQKQFEKQSTKTLKIPTEKIDIIKCECGQLIFIVHGKIEDFELNNSVKRR